jgi:hypothetical protein
LRTGALRRILEPSTWASASEMLCVPPTTCTPPPPHTHTTHDTRHDTHPWSGEPVRR